MRLATIAYIPPLERFNPSVFVANLRKFKTKYPLILFSNDWPDTIKCGDPGSIKSAVNPSTGPARDWSVNNIVFFTALRIAASEQATHILYLEADSRVGCDNWDGILFDEFFTHPGAIIGGSMVTYNPCNAGTEAAARWLDAVSKNSRKNFPIPTYGFKGAGDGSGSCVFVNGSVGIYDMAWMAKLFGLKFDATDRTAQLALKSTAWDMEIGVRLWQQFGPKSYDFIAHLTKSFSSYGDVLSTEAERMDMLRRGDVVACHQVKSKDTV